MTPDERTVLSALELLDTGTEQPIRVWAFKRILDSIECLRNEIRLRDEAITRLEAEFDATCNAEELRQVREDNKRLQAEVVRLESEHTVCRHLVSEIQREATEAALRWAFYYEYPDGGHTEASFVARGLAALLGEGK